MKLCKIIAKSGKRKTKMSYVYNEYILKGTSCIQMDIYSFKGNFT